MGDGFVAVPNLTNDLEVAVDDLFHALFDRHQIIQAERRIACEVVVEAVLDGRTDGYLRARKQFLYRLRHHVACVVTDGLECLGTVARQDFELAATG